MSRSKTCCNCRERLPIGAFTNGHGTCKPCRRLKERNRAYAKKREKFMRLVNWPAPEAA